MVGGGLLCGVASIYAAHQCTVGERDPSSLRLEPSSGAPALPWCAEGLEPVDGAGCYAAPANAPASATPLLIYLHGMFDEGPAAQEELDRQRRVAQKGTARGFAVLALRGTVGACAMTQENASKVCWPSNEKVAYKGPRFVESFAPALAAAARRHPIDKRYVLGFSNGGYFAGLMAVRSIFDAEAFAIAHAGPVEPVAAAGAHMPPILLLSADDDVSQESMVRFDDELTRESWPHEHYVREGGHYLPDSDIDAALTFFVRLRTEKLPLRPPLSTRVPRVRLPRPDAPGGDEGPAPGADGEADAGDAGDAGGAGPDEGPEEGADAGPLPDSF